MVYNQNGANLRAVLYGRVSTEEQGRSGTSLRDQFSGNSEKAKQIGAVIVAHYEDEDSGGFYLTRKNLQRALETVESGQANVFIVKDLVRLTRNDRAEQSQILARIRKSGAQLVFWDSTHEDTALGEFTLNVQGDFAILEKRVIRERTMAGRKRRAKEGQMPTRTHAPFGYILPKKSDVIKGLYTEDQLGKYILHPENASLAREVFERVANGESLNSVVKWLQRTGTPTVAGGVCWRLTNIQGIVNNPAYYGSAAFGRQKTITDETRMLNGFKTRTYEVRVPEEEWVRIPCPAIVTREMWDECQRRIKENRERLSARPTRRLLLTGMLRCPKCRRVMSGRARSHSGMVCHYKCKEASPSNIPNGQVCWKKHINVKYVEPCVIEAVKFASQNSVALETAYDVYRDSLTQGFSEQEYQGLKAQLADLSKQEKNTVMAQIQGVAAGADTDVYESILRDISLNRTSIQGRLDIIENARQSSHQIADKATVIEDSIQDVIRVLDASEELVSTPEKNALLQNIIEHIYPNDDGRQFTVTFRSFDNNTRLVMEVGVAIKPTMKVI